MNILGGIAETGNWGGIPILLILATIRIYLEVIGFDFNELPLTKLVAGRAGADFSGNFHKMGLVFSVGYIVFFAPFYLLA
ncbi:MAG: hypothetical protein KAQ98_04550 [Bacteriovoracaceae bacterium]|nr:hypothetical protein [Bacteriovoracaceae bacterium]